MDNSTMTLKKVSTISIAFSNAALLSYPPRTLSTSTCNRSPSMSNPAVNPARIAAITGASGGIGAQTAKGLVRTLPNLERLYLLCRNVEKGEAVARPLREGAEGKKVDVQVVPLELAENESILQCASSVCESLAGNTLDLLVCNAGIMACPLAFTSNGDGEFGCIEKQYAVNHLSHALLTDGLLGCLRSSGTGRVVFVSSLAVSFARSRTYAPLIEEKTRERITEYSKWACYSDSKLAMSLYAKGLSEREGIECVSLHPGVVQTELSRHVVPGFMQSTAETVDKPGWFGRFLATFGFKTATQGAELTVELCSAPRGGFDNGGMYVGTGGQLMKDSMIPLLGNKMECDKLFEDTKRFIDGCNAEREIEVGDGIRV